MNLDLLRGELERDEGIRLKPYKDTVGKTTLGIGRNLDDVGISREEAEYLLGNDIVRVVTELRQHLPWFVNLNDTQQRVLANMCFELGIGGLMGFPVMLGRVQANDFAGAAEAMLDSTWAKQVPVRAERLAAMMKGTI